MELKLIFKNIEAKFNKQELKYILIDFKLLKIKRKENLPSPEGPVRKHNVQRLLIAAIPEQRRRPRRIHRRSPVISRFNNRPVITVEHQLQIRDSPWVPSRKLQKPPNRKQIPRLNRLLIVLHVDPPAHHRQPEMRRRLPFLHHLPRDSARRPRPQILVYPSEVLRANGPIRWVDGFGFESGRVFIPAGEIVGLVCGGR